MAVFLLIELGFNGTFSTVSSVRFLEEKEPER